MKSSQDRKYEILVRILDRYVQEGAGINRRKSFFDTSSEEKTNQARARALIHLYLASTYGVIDFEERENSITDASNDGGIDGYHIDHENKKIDVIQSKFRVGSKNFESKYILPEEIIAIDLDRVLSGNRFDENGNKYNGYICAFIEKIEKIPDIVRYKAKVTILANVKPEQYTLVSRIFNGDETNIVDFDRCYGELVLPTVRGEQHYTSSMRLQIDLSNKSGNSKLSAEIVTAHGLSEVTVVLVPTLEIAKIMFRYKNSILRYNPRSYLEFREQRTNEGIRSSIVDVSTGEFAILNNGITIVSDETYVNQRVGAQNRAHVEIVNPQIINGGQTAFTLARIFEESSDEDRVRLFSGKEVVLRIITLPQVDELSKKELIRSISSATNSQTAVAPIDRSASNDDNREMAEIVFRRTGLLYEPKRGEYSDAIRKNYVDQEDIVERALFTRLMHMAMGRYGLAVERKMMRSTGGIIPALKNDAPVEIFFEFYEIYREISQLKPHQNAEKLVNDLALTTLVRALRVRRRADGVIDWLPKVLEEARGLWADFLTWKLESVAEAPTPVEGANLRRKAGNYSVPKWIRSAKFPGDVEAYVALLSLEKNPTSDSALVAVRKQNGQGKDRVD